MSGRTVDDAARDEVARMLRSWEYNASAWTDAVRGERIASRRAGTDAAIVDAVMRSSPGNVLDVGCGEGWLARALASRGVRVVGVDASEALIESARALGGGTFEAMTYDVLATRGGSLGAPFDVAVCNFSLLEEHQASLLRTLRDSLAAGGRLVIQTVHPWIAKGDAPYVDGWRTETFAGFGDGFAEPMPWYFRTMAAWVALVGASGFRIARIDEPVDAASGRPLSLVIDAVAER
jgi:2-polyprenyl-3-methyl-5-hydroxy-6-metoxy-1,4-benzoquinol methylase